MLLCLSGWLPMCRGAGLRGVGAMGWSRPLQGTGLQLVRPLLAFSRPETLQACQLTQTEVRTGRAP